MKALILAAGYAVRLYPLTRQYPKPLLKVDNKPIIDYIVDKLKAIDDIDEIIVVTNTKFISRFKKWAGQLNCTKAVSVVDDLTSHPAERRGAIGDIDFSINKKRIKDDLLVIGGDNLFDADLKSFLAFAKHNGAHPAIGVYDLKDLGQANKYGIVRLNRQSKIIDFKEKPKIPKSTLVAMCLYYFPKTKLKLIGEYLNPIRNTKSLKKKNKISNGVKARTDKFDATGFYIDWLRKKIPVYGFVFEGKWYDIGDRRFYSKAKENFQTGGY